MRLPGLRWGLGKGISDKLKLDITQLLKNGLIEFTIPDKPNSRLQKFRLSKRAAKSKKPAG